MKTFNVIMYDFNRRKFKPYDILPYLKDTYKKIKKKPKTYEEVREFIINESRHQWWARCEYEMILSDWPSSGVSEKWDIYQQVMMNIDVITDLLLSEIE